ncbi:unnamed protein product [Heterobilharzia americana]|nr:unnamed protein product [Heterobilharzia americana]
MPFRRKVKKGAYEADDAFNRLQNSGLKGQESGLRVYNGPIDDQTKLTFRRAVPENVMKETVYGQRFYQQQPLQGSNQYLSEDPPENVIDAVHGQRYHNQQHLPQSQKLNIQRELDLDTNEYETIRLNNKYKEAQSYSRPYQRGGDTIYTRPLYSYQTDDIQQRGNVHEVYEPRYNSPYPSRSNQGVGGLPERRIVRETYEPHRNSPYSNRSNQRISGLPEPSSISNNGNTYSYSAPFRPNVEIVYADGRQNRYID